MYRLVSARLRAARVGVRAGGACTLLLCVDVDVGVSEHFGELGLGSPALCQQKQPLGPGVFHRVENGKTLRQRIRFQTTVSPLSDVWQLV